MAEAEAMWVSPSGPHAEDACHVPGAVLRSCTVSLLSLLKISCRSGQTGTVLHRNLERVSYQPGLGAWLHLTTVALGGRLTCGV